MFLNNYRIWTAFFYNHTYQGGSNVFSNIGVLDTSGSEITQAITDMAPSQQYSEMFNGMAYNRNLRAQLRVRLGSGTTAVQPTDYAMENDFTSSLTDVTYTMSIAADDDKLKTIIVISGRNATDTEFTINEIGIYKTLNYYNGSWSSPATKDVLILRQILEAPIVIPAGSSFSYIIELDEA